MHLHLVLLFQHRSQLFDYPCLGIKHELHIRMQRGAVVGSTMKVSEVYFLSTHARRINPTGLIIMELIEPEHSASMACPKVLRRSQIQLAKRYR